MVTPNCCTEDVDMAFWILKVDSVRFVYVRNVPVVAACNGAKRIWNQNCTLNGTKMHTWWRNRSMDCLVNIMWPTILQSNDKDLLPHPRPHTDRPRHPHRPIAVRCPLWQSQTMALWTLAIAIKHARNRTQSTLPDEGSQYAAETSHPYRLLLRETTDLTDFLYLLTKVLYNILYYILRLY